MPIETSVYSINSGFFGMPFDLPGLGLTLRAKHIGDLGTLTILEGWLVNDWNYNMPYGVQGHEAYYRQPFRMFPIGQQLSSVNSYSNNTSFLATSQLTDMLNGIQYGGNYNNFINDSIFRKKVDLLPNNTSNQYFEFNIYFFPYFEGNYRSELKISWIDNINPVLRSFNLNFDASLVGPVSEIDHTDHPQLTLTVDHADTGGFFEIF